VKGHDNKKISGALHGTCAPPTFKFFLAPLTVYEPMHNSVRYYKCKRRFMKLASTLDLLLSVPHGRRHCCWWRKSCHASSAADDFATSELVGWSSDAELHPSSNMSASSLVHLWHTQTRSDQHTHTHTSHHNTPLTWPMAYVWWYIIRERGGMDPASRRGPSQRSGGRKFPIDPGQIPNRQRVDAHEAEAKC